MIKKYLLNGSVTEYLRSQAARSHPGYLLSYKRLSCKLQPTPSSQTTWNPVELPPCDQQIPLHPRLPLALFHSLLSVKVQLSPGSLTSARKSLPLLSQGTYLRARKWVSSSWLPLSVHLTAAPLKTLFLRGSSVFSLSLSLVLPLVL